MCRDIRIDFSSSTVLSVLACLLFSASLSAQSPTPAASPSAPVAESNFAVTSSIEFGVRGLTVNGDRNKYRSDLNYDNGFRLFNSSFLIEDLSGPKLFDSALITTSGWGSDPSGSLTFRMNRTGAYQIDSKFRKVEYFNDLKNHAFNYSAPGLGSEHASNTAHHFGDVDFTLFPESEKFRLNLGFSFNNTEGPGLYTIRFPQFTGQTTSTRGDEFAVNSRIKNKSDDIRVGAAGELIGFNVALNYGHRSFLDSTSFSLSNSPGNNPDPTSADITTFSRVYPTKVKTDFFSFSSNRTFAKKLDFTGRIIYSTSLTNFSQFDSGVGASSASGTSAPRIFLDLDQVNVTGNVKRPQTRGDIGLTYNIDDRFRISNTFNFDQFNIGGGNRFFETLVSRTLAGAARPYDFSDGSSWRATSYRRFTNTTEADYQVNNHFGFHAGYRVTKREVDLAALDRNLVTGALTLQESEKFENTTHTFLAGTKIKPTKSWVIYADFDKGQADNVFTRSGNRDFTNFRVRSRAALKDFSFNVSFASRDNDNPGISSPILGTGGVILFPETETIAKSKSRILSGTIDWSPIPELMITSGYTYNKLDSRVDVLVPVGTPVITTTTWFLGKSQYFVRDNYFHLDVTAKPARRVSVYASYRIDKDKGQGNLVESRAQDIFTSSPMRFQTPEGRVAIRLSKNVDWNIGYQYYSYRETVINNPFANIVITGRPNTQLRLPAQNYNAHLPYTSLRIYFGGRAGDR